MVWDQIEATPPHLTYILLPVFLISYALFASFIRNRLHLSEPPIALLFGIIVGPRVLGWLTPIVCDVNGCADKGAVGGWGWGDEILQESTRIIVGIQVFAVGIELPKFYMARHWKSVAMMLGPVMTFGWLICSLFVYWIFKTDFRTALVVAACLTPTDPVLAASIIGNSQFSNRVPKRIKHMLSAEAGCNDGISFPFLFIGVYCLVESTAVDVAKEWFLMTILWQCAFGILLGMVIGIVANQVLKFSTNRKYIDEAGFTVFYLLLAVMSIGFASILGTDDFLVAFGCGYGFARDGWFTKRTKETHLPSIIDLLLNSAMFVYLGTAIPWHTFSPGTLTPDVTPGRLVGFLILVLLFRRIPIVLATWKWIPDIHTWTEALFCGHFGPMGLGGLFLAIEARAHLETGSSSPLPHPPHYLHPYTDKEKTIMIIWPIVSFIVFGSTLVHGLSVLVLSVLSHFTRPKDKRAGLLAAETDPLDGMVHGVGDGGSEPEDESEVDE
jgi:NhaP-type Na+/H+ or K+/H+ antiporter